jgi:hypothetical protein
MRERFLRPAGEKHRYTQYFFLHIARGLVEGKKEVWEIWSLFIQGPTTTKNLMRKGMMKSNENHSPTCVAKLVLVQNPPNRQLFVEKMGKNCQPNS